MSIASDEKARELFSQFRRKSVTLNKEASGVMTEKDIRELLSDIDENLFRYVFRAFDPNQTGKVDADAFVAATALLTKSFDVDDKLQAVFSIFNTSDEDVLTKAEFKAMMEATVALNLLRMLETKEGMKQMETQLEKEYSMETLTFWHAARDFKLMADDQRLKAAVDMNRKFVDDGADEQVNLPHGMVVKLQGTLKEHKKSGTPPPNTLFEDAEDEIFKLMDRNAHERFRQDPDAVGALCDDFFREADLKQDGVVSYEEYKSFVTSQPAVLTFFSQLSECIQSLLDKAKKASFKNETA